MSSRLIRLAASSMMGFILLYPCPLGRANESSSQKHTVAQAAPLRGAKPLEHPAHGAGTGATDDPVLRAMQKELERSKSQLKLEQMASPYYIEYRVVDTEAYVAEAAFGALRNIPLALVGGVALGISQGERLPFAGGQRGMVLHAVVFCGNAHLAMSLEPPARLSADSQQDAQAS